jgi:hypothetical protein|tara:strand:- start:1437 stop:1838 length:402 start_codon:yes stop_codon:yes gene_type:complete
MKKLMKTLVVFAIPLFIIMCEGGSSKNKSSSNSILNNYSYINITGEPDEDWVGKYLKIQFDNTGSKLMAGKIKIIQLVDYNKDDEGYKYFSVKDLSDGIIQDIYFFWFGNYGSKNGFGPNIKLWKEAIPKNTG